jgi:DNA-binding MarR family transcriptional regulator
MVSISKDGVKLMASVAPNSEAIYAEITRRFGARKLAELQEMLGELEHSLAGLGASEEASPEE